MAGRKQGVQKEIEESRNGGEERGLQPAALPCGDVTTSRASQGLASCQTGRGTQLGHLVSVGDGMTGNVQMGGSASCHMKLCHASQTVIKKERTKQRQCAGGARRGTITATFDETSSSAFFLSYQLFFGISHVSLMC